MVTYTWILDADHILVFNGGAQVSSAVGTPSYSLGTAPFLKVILLKKRLELLRGDQYYIYEDKSNSFTIG